jgi:hypothetical protein
MKCSVIETLHDDEYDVQEHDMSALKEEQEHGEVHEPESLPTPDVNNIRRS